MKTKQWYHDDLAMEHDPNSLEAAESYHNIGIVLYGKGDLDGALVGAVPTCAGDSRVTGFEFLNSCRLVQQYWHIAV